MSYCQRLKIIAFNTFALYIDSIFRIYHLEIFRYNLCEVLRGEPYFYEGLFSCDEKLEAAHLKTK